MSDFWRSLQSTTASSSSSSSSSSRPETASARPGTSSGRRHLTSSAVTSSHAHGSGTTTTALTADLLLRETDKDDLLRIMNQNRHLLENEALLRAEQGDLDSLRRLISLGLDLRCRGYKGCTLLHNAASRGHCAVIAELVRHRVIEIDTQNDAGESALHLAVYGGHLLATDQLLDYHADVNLCNNHRETPLFYAARKDSSAVVRLLLQRGADAALVDDYDERAADHATNPLVLKAFAAGERARNDVPSSSSSSSSERESGSGRITLTLAARFSYDDLLRIFAYLSVNDILRVACVCTKWHRATEHDGIWRALGVRRWELSLQSRLGFAPTTTSSFLNRPRSKTSANGTTSGTNSVASLSRNNSGRASTLVSRIVS